MSTCVSTKTISSFSPNCSLSYYTNRVHGSSYQEATITIYKSNTFHIDNLSFLACRQNRQRKPRTSYDPSQLKLLYFPPKLGIITSMELVSWLFTAVQTEIRSPNNQRHWDEYTLMLNAVPDFFPCLTSLDISVRPSDHFDSRTLSKEGLIMQTHENCLLGPIDELCQKYGAQLRFLSLAVPLTHYMRLKARAVRLRARSEVAEHEQPELERYWRPVEPSKQDNAVPQLGYWIRQGVNNLAEGAGSHAYPNGAMNLLQHIPGKSNMSRPVQSFPKRIP